MINEGKNLNDNSNTNEEISKKFIKYKKEDTSHESIDKVDVNKNKKEIYPRLLKNNESHYYNIDDNNIEWEFTEINGTKNNYYFKCSSIKCGGFGMINRLLKDKIFVLTKEHKLEYYKHSYYKLKYNYEMLINNNLTKNDFDNEELRYNLFKIYFEENKFHDEKHVLNFSKLDLMIY